MQYLLPESSLYTDGQGAVAPGHVGQERTIIRHAGEEIGAIVHAPRPDEHPEHVDAVAAAAGLAVEIARLRVELRRQLEEVQASRARIIAAGDAERRRIERDLHDGAQQRLVSIGLVLRHAQHRLQGDSMPEVWKALDGAVEQITTAIEELRELARGLRPAQLNDGLGPALRDLASRSPIPVEVAAPDERFADEVETSAYFIACEALTNAVKHAHATKVVLEVSRRNGALLVRIADDGVGAAAVNQGTGLTSMSDRVAAHGGSLRIESPPGAGTTLIAEIPCGS